MLIPKTKFLIERVGGMQFTRDRKHRFIDVVLRKPAPVTEFDERIGTDDFICAQVFNERADNLPLFRKGDKVEAQLILNANERLKQDQSGLFYDYKFSIRSIEKID